MQIGLKLAWVLSISMLTAANAQQPDSGIQIGSHSADFLERLGENRSVSATTVHLAVLTSDDIQALKRARINQAVTLPSLGLSKSVGLSFRRIDIYAPDAVVQVIGSDGTSLRSTGQRAFFIAIDRDASAGFSMDLNSGQVRGMLIEGQETFELASAPAKNGGQEVTLHRLSETHKDAVFRCEIDQSVQREYDAIRAPSMPFVSRNAAQKGTLIYQTTIAVDTDNEFLFNKFGNDAGAAQSYIEDLFLNLNMIYERDLAMRLVLGSVTLRIDDDGTPDFTQDPYGDNDGLTEFGLYWQQNLTNIDRAFAMLLSGKGVGSNSFSGVAWVEAYCINTERFPGSGFGSFSFNRIGSSLSAAFVSGGIGHEIGHNLGSFHTHCEMLRSGGTDWVDHCYNESSNGTPDPDCYQGPPECVADGAGSLMSYCHAPPDGFDGPGIEIGPPTSPACTNSDVMDPLIIGKLNNLVAMNNPACINDFSGGQIQLIFASSFEAGQ